MCSPPDPIDVPKEQKLVQPACRRELETLSRVRDAPIRGKDAFLPGSAVAQSGSDDQQSGSASASGYPRDRAAPRRSTSSRSEVFACRPGRHDRAVPGGGGAPFSGGRAYGWSVERYGGTGAVVTPWEVATAIVSLGPLCRGQRIRGVRPRWRSGGQG